MGKRPFRMTTRGLDKVQRMIRDFPGRAAVIFDDKLKSGARVMAVELARYSVPFGGKAGDEKLFQNTIAGEIRSVFSPSQVYEDLLKESGKGGAGAGLARAQQFWWLMANGKSKAAKALLEKEGGRFGGIDFRATVPAADHKAARRGKRGSVKRPNPQKVVVINQNKLDRYIAKKQKTVGAAKAGWMAAAKAASASGRVGKGMPAWANTGRHKKATGSVVYTGGQGKRVALVRNHVPWAAVALPKRLEVKAMDSARGRLRKALYIALMMEEGKLSRRLARV